MVTRVKNTAKARAKAITDSLDRVSQQGARVAGPLFVTLALAVGAAGALVALQHHGGEPALRSEQSRSLAMVGAATLSAARVQAFVVRAPEPVLPARRTGPVGVRCVAGGGGPLRNPWSCRIRYRSGTVARYRVIVQPNGYYRGMGSGIIEGCCIQTPAGD